MTEPIWIVKKYPRSEIEHMTAAAVNYRENGCNRCKDKKVDGKGHTIAYCDEGMKSLLRSILRHFKNQLAHLDCSKLPKEISHDYWPETFSAACLQFYRQKVRKFSQDKTVSDNDADEQAT